MDKCRLVVPLFFGLALFGVTRSGPSADTDVVPTTNERAGLSYRDRVLILRFANQFMPHRSDVDLAQRKFGNAQLDSVLSAHEPTRIAKLIPTYSQARTAAGRSIERTFILYYSGGVDPAFLADEISELPFFDKVSVDWIYPSAWAGTAREIPRDNQFIHQWSLDYSRDSVDIDMPEAWAIEQGDPNVVIGILDTGTMLDTSNVTWALHPDFNYRFTVEDNSPYNAIGWSDYDTTDAGDPDSLPDDPYVGLDNVVGVNYSFRYDNETDDVVNSFWSNTPHNWLIQPSKGWEVSGYFKHGIHVAGIAAAKADFGTTTSGIAGIAPLCEVYFVRRDSKLSIAQETQALISASDFSDVINMSWGFCTEPDYYPFHDAIDYVAEERDVVLVAAVGNLSVFQATCPGLPVDVWSPARWDNVMGVSNMDSTLTLYHDSVSALDSGLVSVTAPTGAGVPTTSHSDCLVEPHPCLLDFTVVSFNGTSGASPHAAGIAALVRSRFPGLNQAQVRQRIEHSCEYYWEDTATERKKYGNGKVNAYRALTEWGEISSSVTWNATDTRDGSYYVSGDVVIPSGVTLTIGAGTKIRVAPDNEHNQVLGLDSSRVEIIVKGSLNIAGTSADPVVFESFTDSPGTSGDWLGIRFDATSSNNELNHVVIKHAQKGIENYATVAIANTLIDSCYTGIEAHAALVGVSGEAGATISHAGWGILSYASIALDGYTITDCIEGIQSHGDLAIASSTFSDHSAYGVDIVSGRTTLDDVVISGCPTGVNINGQSATLVCDGSTISDCTYRGISVASSGDTLLASNMTVRDNYEGVYVGSGAYAEMDTCSLVANDTGVSAILADHADIRNCVIDSSATNGVYCMLSDDVTISATMLSHGAVGLFCYVNSNPSINGASWAKQNTTGIKCDYYCSPTIRSTKITGSTTGVMAFEGSTPDLDGSCGTPCNGNSIHHNTSADVANFDSLTTILARCVYWGSPSGPDPGSFVGSVDYVPYCSDNPLPTSPGPVVDKEEPDDGFPTTYGLSCNYPNPFNPITRLRYDVPRPGGKVEIVVFDVRGRRVKTLVSEPTSPGVHAVQWDGIDETGAQAASGVYFVRMTAGSFGETRKLVLLK